MSPGARPMLPPTPPRKLRKLRRLPRSGRLPALALGLAALAVAGVVLALVWRSLGGRAEAIPTASAPPLPSAPPAPLQEIPFDRPTVDGGVWFLELDAPWEWGSDTLENLAGRLRACRGFVADGRFAGLYPEAGEAEVRLRIVCERTPPKWAVRQLRAVVAGWKDVPVEGRGPGGTPIVLQGAVRTETGMR